MSLAVRDRQPELMDDPSLDSGLHRQALAGLRRVSLISGTVRTFWKPIAELAAKSGRPIRVLDVACGGGDTVIDLAQRAERAGLDIVAAGCDLSPTAVGIAAQSAAEKGADVQFFTADALTELPEGFDVICCSLFLHHLAEDDVVCLLKTMKAAAGTMILAGDLIRSRLGYALCSVGIRLLTRSRICHVDGPLSVRAAFTMKEIQSLAEAAGLETAEFTRHWPERYLMKWVRP